MSTEYTSDDFVMNRHMVPREPQKPNDDFTLAVLRQLRAMSDKIESGELIIQEISFQALDGDRQRVTVTTDAF